MAFWLGIGLMIFYLILLTLYAKGIIKRGLLCMSVIVLLLWVLLTGIYCFDVWVLPRFGNFDGIPVTNLMHFFASEDRKNVEIYRALVWGICFIVGGIGMVILSALLKRKKKA